MNKTIFFRNDDVQDSDVHFKKFIGLFLFHKIPLHLAVIPGNMTMRCEVFLRQCLKKYPELIEIGQHGYKHLNYSENFEFKYEFGPGRTYADQREDIARGRAILRKFTKHKLIFTPPWHGFDKNTLKAIYELGFLGISLDEKSKFPKNFHPVKNFMTQVYFNKKNSLGWYLDGTDAILNQIKHVQGDIVGILSHHDELKNDQEFNQLSDLLARLKKIPGVRFCQLSKSGNLSA